MSMCPALFGPLLKVCVIGGRGCLLGTPGPSAANIKAATLVLYARLSPWALFGSILSNICFSFTDIHISFAI